MFAREGYSTILFVSIFAVLITLGAQYLNHWTSYLLYAVAFFLVGFMLYFFRDPDREIPENENLLLAPADGKIVLVKEVEENIYIRDTATQISIFHSPLDVHVNRLPAAGTIEYIKYHPGIYLMAWDHRASDMNERADFGLLHPTGTKLFFRQITGFLARRIVYHIKQGDQVKQGERFGMMKFGSRMDILVPSDVNIHAKEGDRTVGGETVLGTINA